MANRVLKRAINPINRNPCETGLKNSLRSGFSYGAAGGGGGGGGNRS